MHIESRNAFARTFGLRLFAILAVVSVTAAAHADPIVTKPFDPNVDCAAWLDALGSVVAGGGDYDGDGVADVAYAAPCAPVRSRLGVGRIWIRSGSTGAILRRARGAQEKMYFGASLAFLDDLNGDGKDEVAVGAPGFDGGLNAPAAEPLVDAGQLRIYSRKNRLAYRKIVGDFAKGEFAASVAGMTDLDGDGVSDLLVGAPGEPRSTSDTTRTGAVHILSGASKTAPPIARLIGRKTAQRFGTTVRNVGRFDTDVNDDILVTSEKNPVGGVENAGGVEVISGLDLASVLLEVGGAANDRLGASSASAGTDGSFIVGVPGRRLDDGTRRAGAVTAYADDRSIAFSLRSSEPQLAAQYGTAVSVIGDIDGDGVGDYAASEPFLDLPVDALRSDLEEDVGRVAFLSGAGGADIFDVLGTRTGSRLGRALAGGVDWNDDGVPDLVSGNPGDSPDLRRGAGSVSIHSGIDGSRLVTYRGRRGLETRIVAATRGGSGVLVRAFRADGAPAVVNAEVLKGVDIGEGEVSVDVLDRTLTPPEPGKSRIAVGTGHAAEASNVAVISASNKQRILQEFEAFPGEAFGAIVAAGDLENEGRDELVIAQGSSENGRVRVKVFAQNKGDPSITGWVNTFEFDAFEQAEKFGDLPIAADGANLLVTGLRPEAGREIIVAPVLGLPIVRVFGQTGTLLLQWQAYELDGSVDGLSIAAGDLDGDGNKEIITAPTVGQAAIRAFNDDGLPFSMPGEASPVYFLALPAQNVSGVRVTTADVDLDDRQEIVVVSRKAGQDEIRVFEPDGTEVEGFSPIDPFDGGTSVAISATDRFLPR
ncbi:MAG TPA: integrin alpha [Candidatus Binatia bacterium]|nr:integrin alpha [Candidatus Binatia bacterium]